MLKRVETDLADEPLYARVLGSYVLADTSIVGIFDSAEMSEL